jgi:hypothetical protein
MWGAAFAREDAAVLLFGGNYDNEVIPLSPILLVWYVWLLHMVTRFLCSCRMQG